MNLIKDKLPLLGHDEDSILKTIKQVLKSDTVTRFDVDARTGMISFWRAPSEDEKERELSNPFREIFRRVPMEEYVPDGDIGSHEQLFQIFDILHDAGCIPAFIVIGNLESFRKWIKFPRRSNQLAGVPIYVVRELADTAEDALLVCGSKVRDPEPIDVDFVVKVTLP